MFKQMVRIIALLAILISSTTMALCKLGEVYSATHGCVPQRNAVRPPPGHQPNLSDRYSDRYGDRYRRQQELQQRYQTQPNRDLEAYQRQQRVYDLYDLYDE